MSGDWDDGGSAPAAEAGEDLSPAAKVHGLEQRVTELEGLLWEWTFSDWSSHGPAFEDLDARSQDALRDRCRIPPLYMTRYGREFCRCLAPAWVDGGTRRRELADFDGEWSAREGCPSCGGRGRVDCQGCQRERGGGAGVPAGFTCPRCAWRPGRTEGGREK